MTQTPTRDRCSEQPDAAPADRPTPRTASERAGCHDGPLRHLAELRRRLVICLVAITLGAIAGLIWNRPILALFTEPFLATRAGLGADRAATMSLNLSGVVEPLTVPLRIAGLTGVVLASPVWLGQLWGFIVPGLYQRERRWVGATLGVSIPLFLTGVALCYALLPKAIRVMLTLTPDGFTNIISFSDYLSFFVRMLLVFGAAFLLPVALVLLNALGLLPATVLRRARRYVVVGIFIFAAVATPTGDPLTMSLLAVPMTALFEAAVAWCHFHDRRGTPA